MLQKLLLLKKKTPNNSVSVYEHIGLKNRQQQSCSLLSNVSENLTKYKELVNKFYV